MADATVEERGDVEQGSAPEEAPKEEESDDKDVQEPATVVETTEEAIGVDAAAAEARSTKGERE